MRLLLTPWSCWWILLACTDSFVVSAAVTSLPNPLKDPETCRSDNTTYRICDPNAILTLAERQAVQEEIELFETNNATCGQEEVAPVQMGVALVRTMNAPFGTNLATMARQRATDIHNAWGIGYQTSKCGGTGLLLFLAIDDHQIYLSRGKALSTILSSDRLTYVVGKVKPHLRDGQYKQGITLGVQLLTAYMSGNRPGFDETFEAVTTLLGILTAFCACIGCMACIDFCHRRRDNRLKQELRQDLARLDHDRQLALQGKYQSTSCPICLEDFRPNEANIGERKPLLWHPHHHEAPLQLLSCGHVFHQTCWNDFLDHPNTPAGQSTDNDKSSMKCPICRQPVEPSTATRSITQGVMDDAAYQPERRFRLGRLQELYPTFVGTQYVDQWYDPEYRGSLLDDYNTMEQEQQAEAERALLEQNRMFAYGESGEDLDNDDDPPDFGGGQADGGGVGGTF